MESDRSTVGENESPPTCSFEGAWAWDATMVWMIAGLIVLVIVAQRNTKRGINMSKIHAEIPPP
jgi:hypothetical protein